MCVTIEFGVNSISFQRVRALESDREFPITAVGCFMLGLLNGLTTDVWLNRGNQLP